MKDCVNCKMPISKDADMCPSCGHQTMVKLRKDFARRIRNICLVWIVLLLLAVFTGTYPMSDFFLVVLCIPFLCILLKDLISNVIMRG